MTFKINGVHAKFHRPNLNAAVDELSVLSCSQRNKEKKLATVKRQKMRSVILIFTLKSQ